ncbi:hypothetical protein MA16_Dca009401 [Dendrobium catenatum]|uniref:Uncharacterized protein n=1 Tax=Dendrobium catenatum TaxID=906689 RepID=A0A2I0XH66_9ASPA|nr:hypothetical protein MA16_Dca009401 [Dendrobium catenatum]
MCFDLRRNEERASSPVGEIEMGKDERAEIFKWYDAMGGGIEGQRRAEKRRGVNNSLLFRSVSALLL